MTQEEFCKKEAQLLVIDGYIAHLSEKLTNEWLRKEAITSELLEVCNANPEIIVKNQRVNAYRREQLVKLKEGAKKIGTVA